VDGLSRHAWRSLRRHAAFVPAGAPASLRTGWHYIASGRQGQADLTRFAHSGQARGRPAGRDGVRWTGRGPDAPAKARPLAPDEGAQPPDELATSSYTSGSTAAGQGRGVGQRAHLQLSSGWSAEGTESPATTGLYPGLTNMRSTLSRRGDLGPVDVMRHDVTKRTGGQAACRTSGAFLGAPWDPRCAECPRYWSDGRCNPELRFLLVSGE